MAKDDGDDVDEGSEVQEEETGKSVMHDVVERKENGADVRVEDGREMEMEERNFQSLELGNEEDQMD